MPTIILTRKHLMRLQRTDNQDGTSKPVVDLVPTVVVMLVQSCFVFTAYLEGFHSRLTRCSRPRLHFPPNNSVAEVIHCSFSGLELDSWFAALVSVSRCKNTHSTFDSSERTEVTTANAWYLG
jgi:hypothetical protein